VSRRGFRRRLAKGFALALLAVVVVVLVRYARSVDWHSVGKAVSDYPLGVLLLAQALAALSYLLYGGYDLAARRYTGHRLSTRRVFGIAFVSYAFNMNFGALIGSAGFRYRLYSRSGVRTGAIARIIVFSIVTNWLGYVVMAGSALALAVVPLPGALKIDASLLRGIGLAMLLAACAYLSACARKRPLTLTLRGHAFGLPRPSLALSQLVLSSANWLTIAAVVFVLLRQEVAYPAVLGVVLVGAIIAAIAHIPAGLGALEATFIALLGEQLPQSQLLAALLVYRAVYYLVPLLLAILVYSGFEARTLARKQRSRNWSGRRE
jgi:glycosyltransferase 2 family protein